MPRPKPHLVIYSDDMPEIKNFNIGEIVRLNIKVEVVKLNKGDEYGMPMEGEKESKIIFAKCKVISADVLKEKMSFEEEKGQRLADASAKKNQ
ncbi:MAG: hypothetical protein ABIC19_00675 [Patescibacteria group bacterium]|nr:hypothetical protein [Patescibacteria group bacterium]